MNNTIFAVYKPKGVTSAKFLNKLKKCMFPDMKGIKIGHAGTLDPNASGILIIGTGPSTRLLSGYIKCEKAYVATVSLGYTSDTYDDGGIKSFVSDQQPNGEAISQALGKFIGTISQVPPKYSAIHINGKRAYDLARSGKDFSIPSREVTIYSIDLIKYGYPTIVMKVRCSSGTYIRSLAYDIGNLLGCGGYLKDLERISAGGFEIKDCIDLPVTKN
jgi:tRNA pseudouridine55 synthase